MSLTPMAVSTHAADAEVRAGVEMRLHVTPETVHQSREVQ